MDEKNLSEGDSSGARITRGKIFFVHLFSTIFHFFIIFFQAFNPSLDDFWPLKNNLLGLNKIQWIKFVPEICSLLIKSVLIRNASELLYSISGISFDPS